MCQSVWAVRRYARDTLRGGEAPVLYAASVSGIGAQREERLGDRPQAIETGTGMTRFVPFASLQDDNNDRTDYSGVHHLV